MPNKSADRPIPKAQWDKLTQAEQQKIIASRKKGKKNEKPQKKGKTYKKTNYRKHDNVRTKGRVTNEMVTQMVSSSALIPNQDPRIQISGTFNLNSYRNAYVALLSYLQQKNVVNVDVENQPAQWRTIYNGVQYMIQSGADNFQGTTQTLNKVPKVIDILYQALTPKVLKYECGQISYGWKPFDPLTIGLTPLAIYGKIWAPTFVQSDGGGQAELVTIWLPTSSKDDYSNLLAIINKLDVNGNLNTVDSKSTPTLRKDVSPFARVYSYVGNQSTPSLGGAWLNVENEVKVTAPIMAKFVQYEDSSLVQDPRLARSLCPSSLDSLCTIGWPLHDSFRGYYNKNPPRVNQIDCDQFYTWIALWMAKLKSKANELGVPGALDPLPMTPQTFYLCLRGAMMTIFDSQYFMQFQGNNMWQNNSNAFLGFFVMAHCAGNPVFGTLNVPQIVAENLAALKARSFGPPGGKNPQSFIPVVGRYYRDTLPIINIVDANGVALGPLFDSTIIEQPIDFIHCEGPGGFVNVQGNYYQTAVDDWNTAVEKYKQYSSPVQEILCDSGPKGLLACVTTRLIKSMSIEGDLVSVPVRVAQSLNYLSNKPYDPIKMGGKIQLVKRKKDPKDPKIIPDATIVNLTTSTITSKFEITQEMSELLNLICLPTDRPDETNDVLLKSMIQVIGKQPYSYNSNTVVIQVGGTGAGEWMRLNQLANECVTGLGRDITTKFQEVFKKLITDGEGGFLTSMLAGVVKGIFPGSDAIVDTIASVSPI